MNKEMLIKSNSVCIYIYNIIIGISFKSGHEERKLLASIDSHQKTGDSDTTGSSTSHGEKSLQHPCLVDVV